MEEFCCPVPSYKEKVKKLWDILCGRMDQNDTHSLSAEYTNKSGCPLWREHLII